MTEMHKIQINVLMFRIHCDDCLYHDDLWYYFSWVCII